MSACGDPAAIAEWWSGLAATLFFGGLAVAILIVVVAWVRTWSR